MLSNTIAQMIVGALIGSLFYQLVVRFFEYRMKRKKKKPTATDLDYIALKAKLEKLIRTETMLEEVIRDSWITNMRPNQLYSYKKQLEQVKDQIKTTAFQMIERKQASKLTLKKNLQKHELN